MGSRYLTDLASVVRGAGITVQEEPGWQTRARGSGGYDSGKPDHLMIHHTASGPSSDGQSDVNYMCYGSDNRPIANLYLSRSGKVWIMAAGATNTNGSGTCPHCGATDNMNSRAIGIEGANGGTGEAWPKAQTDAYVALCSALSAHYDIPNAALWHHAGYAPSRKIDPAGPSPWASGSATWNISAFRSSVGSGPGPGPGPGPQEDDDVAVCIKSGDGTSEQKFATFSWIPGISIGWLTSQLQIDIGRITGTLKFESDGDPLLNFGAVEIQDMINRYWAGGPKPPGWK